MRELALFAGAGGGILGGVLLGWHTVCAVEIDAYCRKVLLARQRDGLLPRFPIWDDVRTFDGTPWKDRVDVISGGFPCQDISCAGRGAGIDGVRSGLWREMARITDEIRPRYVFVENSPLLVSRGLVVVVSDLASMGYDVRWCCVSASNAGAAHIRDRIWILADSLKDRRYWGFCKVHNSGKRDASGYDVQYLVDSFWDTVESLGIGTANDVAYGLDRIKALGNGQVPAVVRLAWNTLNGIPQENRLYKKGGQND